MVDRTRRVAWVTAAIVGVYAASSSAASEVNGRGQPTESGDPGHCVASKIERTIGAYFRDLTHGHLGDALARIASSDRFNWYSVDTRPYAGSRLGVAAHRYPTLSRYLDARHSHGETWTLQHVTYYGERQGERVGNFGLSLLRAATDLGAGKQLMRGKGAIDCTSGRIMLMSLDARTTRGA